MRPAIERYRDLCGDLYSARKDVELDRQRLRDAEDRVSRLERRVSLAFSQLSREEQDEITMMVQR